MQASHTAAAVSATFDDPNLGSCAGLVPLLRLAEDVGLTCLADQRVRLGKPVGANAGAKVTSIVAGMATGADSIDDLDVIRHGALPGLFGGIRAPSTLGSFLRGFTHGHVSQLEAVARQELIALAGRTPAAAGGPSTRLRRHRFQDLSGLWPGQAGRGVRLYQGARAEPAGGDPLQSALGAGDCGQPAR